MGTLLIVIISQLVIEFPTFEIILPPTIMGNPVPATAEIHTGIAFVHMMGQDVDGTRLSIYSGRNIFFRGFALKGEAGIYVFHFKDDGYNIALPILNFGASFSRKFGKLSGTLGISVGIPELLLPYLDVGLYLKEVERLTIRLGPISSFTIHHGPADFALLVDWFSTDGDLFANVSYGFAFGFNFK